jgi:hypothetical protein
LSYNKGMKGKNTMKKFLVVIMIGDGVSCQVSVDTVVAKSKYHAAAKATRLHDYFGEMLRDWRVCEIN